MDKSREYIPSFGFQMDDNFAMHQGHCERCAKYDERVPASAGMLCLDGAILLKELKAKDAPKREQLIRPEHWAPMKEVKAAMRYK